MLQIVRCYNQIYFCGILQDRLNKVHEQAVREASRRKPLIEPSPVASSSSTSALSSSATGHSSQTHQQPPSLKEGDKDPETEEKTAT